MSPIYKTPSGPYIDLDRLLVVGDPCFCANSRVEFGMIFQLHEKPFVSYVMIKNPYPSSNTLDLTYSFLRSDGTWSDYHGAGEMLPSVKTHYVTPILQAWEVWKEYKKELRD